MFHNSYYNFSPSLFRYVNCAWVGDLLSFNYPIIIKAIQFAWDKLLMSFAVITPVLKLQHLLQNNCKTNESTFFRILFQISFLQILSFFSMYWYCRTSVLPHGFMFCWDSTAVLWAWGAPCGVAAGCCGCKASLSLQWGLKGDLVGTLFLLECYS